MSETNKSTIENSLNEETNNLSNSNLTIENFLNKEENNLEKLLMDKLKENHNEQTCSLNYHPNSYDQNYPPAHLINNAISRLETLEQRLREEKILKNGYNCSDSDSDDETDEDNEDTVIEIFKSLSNAQTLLCKAFSKYVDMKN